MKNEIEERIHNQIHAHIGMWYMNEIVLQTNSEWADCSIITIWKDYLMVYLSHVKHKNKQQFKDKCEKLNLKILVDQ